MTFLLALSGVSPACSSAGYLLTGAGGSDGGAAGASGGSGGAGLRDGGGASCPSIRLPTAAGATCAAALATRSQRYALCACDSLNLGTRLNTDTFDSTGKTIESNAAAIGVNGDLQTSAVIQAFGSVQVAGAGGLATSELLVSLSSLSVAGPMRISSPGGLVEVTGDAYAGGEIQGTLVVIGTLHLMPSAVTPLSDITVGDFVFEPVSVPPPCDCGAGVVDVAGAIAAAAKTNDNLAAGLSPDRLASVTTSTVVDIPCGTFSLTTIDAQQGLFLAVHGRALVAVSGDVVVRAGFTVTLDPGAELDLLVGGRLLASGGNPFGSVNPARFRIWVAGSQSVVFDDAPTVGAVIRAAGAPVTASSGLDLSGALLARSLTSGGQVNVHYDQAILSAGVPCGEPPARPVP